MSVAFELVVECCRRGFGDGGSLRLQALAQDADWPTVLRLARRHRVEALVWDALTSFDVPVPPEIAAALKEAATGTADHNLRSAAECARLANAFAATGIPLLFLKGLTLAALAYPNPFLKMGWDIDVLVAPKRLGDSAALLGELGYTAVVPATQRIDDVLRWHRSRKESVWRDASRGCHVELHGRLADNARLLPQLSAHSPAQQVAIAPGIELATLADTELFAYLTVHGASSAWFRLKWIADLAGFLHRRQDRTAELYEASLAHGAGRAPAQALLLADRLFGSLEGTPLRASLERDRTARWLASAAYRSLHGRHPLDEPMERRFGTAIIHATQFGLLPGPAFKISELGRQLRCLWP